MITDLVAGPELDAVVAKAIGCVGVTTPAGTWWYLDGKPLYQMPRFSSDIAAAWIVVDWMLEQDDQALYLRFVAEWGKLGIIALSSTAPVRICRAALMALDKSAAR